MKNDRQEILEQAVTWFKRAGFDGDLSSFVAGVLDVADGIEDIQSRILPALLKTPPGQTEDVLTIISDLSRQLEHISEHSEELRSFGIKALEFFDSID